jgi:hypothetical protein
MIIMDNGFNISDSFGDLEKNLMSLSGLLEGINEAKQAQITKVA